MSLFQLSEATSLALHAMAILIKNKEEPVRVKEIAEICNASQAHLAKVMQRLSHQGFVEANRGPKGGYVASAKGMEASILDIYEAMEGPFQPTQCLLSKKICIFEECIFRGVVAKSEKEIIDYFRQTRLKELVL